MSTTWDLPATTAVDWRLTFFGGECQLSLWHLIARLFCSCVWTLWPKHSDFDPKMQVCPKVRQCPCCFANYFWCVIRSVICRKCAHLKSLLSLSCHVLGIDTCSTWHTDSWAQWHFSDIDLAPDGLLKTDRTNRVGSWTPTMFRVFSVSVHKLDDELC